jgi:putative transposase
VLDEIVQTLRNTKAANRLVTDKLGSYGAANKQVVPKIEHRSHKGLNNRAKNSHVPLRKRERIVLHFRSARAL